MTSPEYDSEQTVGHRRQTGTGLAARFTLRLGLMTLLIAGVAGFLFLQGAEKLNRDAAAEARLDSQPSGHGLCTLPDRPPGQRSGKPG